jgi:RHS repeat-associated protein
MSRFGFVFSSQHSFKGSLFFWVVAPVLLSCVQAMAQIQTTLSNNDTGIHDHQMYVGDHESINPLSGNLNIQIPLIHLPGRAGDDLDVKMSYNSDYWNVFSYTAPNGHTDLIWNVDVLPSELSSILGWNSGIPYLTYMNQQVGGTGGTVIDCYAGYQLVLPDGSKHTFSLGTQGVFTGCTINNGENTFPDPSGDVPMGLDPDGFIQFNGNTNTATLRDGTNLIFPGSNSTATVEDRNGNKIVYGSPIVDTLGRQISSVTSGGTTTMTYTDDNGLTQNIKITTASITLNPTYASFLNTPPNAANTSVTIDAPFTATVLTSIQLPNTTSYTFQYDPTNTFGELVKVTYPTGGYTRYDYVTILGPDPNLLVGGYDARRYVAHKYVCSVASASNVGSGNTCSVSEQKTTFNPQWNSNGVFTSTITNPDNTQIVFSRSEANATETIQFFNSNATQPTRTINRTLMGATFYSDGPASSQTITLNDGPSSPSTTTTWSYDSYTPPSGTFVGTCYIPCGLIDDPIDVKTTDYTSSVIRETKTTYDTAYRAQSPHIMDLPSTVQTLDGNSNLMAETDNVYDAGTLTNRTGVLAGVHDSNYGTSYTTRGNATSVVKLLLAPTRSQTTTAMTYDILGNMVSKQEPNGVTNGSGYTTTYGYTDSWGNTACAPVSGSVFAYVSSVTNALNQITSSTYNSCTGRTASTTDANLEPTNFSYDSMGRPTQTSFPDGGQISEAYSHNILPASVQTTTLITTSVSKVVNVVQDGLGRTSQTQLTSDPSGTDFTDTTYDGLGRKSTVSNPYRTTSSTTDGTTTYSYDVLDRVTMVSQPDTSSINTTYSGNCTTVKDEAGKARESCSDALGRMTQVFEDPSGLNYETDYAYDALGNLLSVNQKGGSPTSSNWRTRTFTYDSLSRLLCAANPEIQAVTCPNAPATTYPIGATVYSYDSNGNMVTKTAPSPNQSPSGTKTATTTYSYDQLNRLTGKSYNDGYTSNGPTPSSSYAYDGTTLTGCTTTPPTLADSYPIGHRTSMCDGSGGTSWAYDKMNRVLQERRTIGTVKGDFENDAFNLDGSVQSVTSLGYGVGYSYSGAARPLTAGHGSPNIVQGATYTPPGELSGATLGSAGLTVTNVYNNRLQPILLSAGVSGHNAVFSECFDFHLGIAVNTPPCSFLASALGDNGNVNQVVNNRNNTRSESFNYDSLNRITNGQSSGTQWGEAYSTDAWGNMTAISSYQGKPAEGGLTTTASSNNQLVGFGYDPAGNMTSNGSASYVYDDENRLIWTKNNASSYRYIYDGNGERVEKCVAATPTTACPTSGSSGTLYWKGIGSDPLTETDLGGTVQNTYVFFNGKRIARIDSTGAAHYYFSDHLGTHAVVVNATASACEQDIDYYPYGGVQYDYCTTPVAQNYKFNGKERDIESGLDNFGARFNASNLGRFMTPDWAAKPTDVPYANFGNPQSLNLYAYVENNPTTLGDPDGHDTVTGGPCAAAANRLCGMQDAKLDDKKHPFWWNVGHFFGWVQTEEEKKAAAAEEAKRRADWAKAHPGLPYPDIRLGIVYPVGGMGGSAGGIGGVTRPAWASDAGGFVNWLKNLQAAGTKLTAEEADQVISEAKNLGVDVRLDPPHPGTNWDVPHLNLGSSGQVHLEVPEGYSNPRLATGQP